MIRLTEILTPFYLLITIGFALLVLHSKERSLLRDPRLPGMVIRCVVYPAVILFLFLFGLALAGTALGSGTWWGLPVAAVTAVCSLTLSAWLIPVAVGNVRKLLRNPPR